MDCVEHVLNDETLQAVFGAEAIKGGVKLAKGVQQVKKATKAAGKAAQKGAKGAKAAVEAEKVGSKVVGKGAVLNLKDVKLLQELYLTQKGINPHTFKQEWLGKKAVLKHFDIYRHSKTGELIIFQKGGKEIPIQTGKFIN